MVRGPRPPPARHPRAIPCHTIVPSLHMSRDGVAGACRRFGRLDTYRVVGIAAIADCHPGVLDSLVGCKVSQTRKQVRPPSPHRPNTHTLFVFRHQFHLPLLSHRFSRLRPPHTTCWPRHTARPRAQATCSISRLSGQPDQQLGQHDKDAAESLLPVRATWVRADPRGGALLRGQDRVHRGFREV